MSYLIKRAARSLYEYSLQKLYENAVEIMIERGFEAKNVKKIGGKIILEVDDSEKTGYETDFINSKLQQLLNKRLNKWTVITSNLSLNDFSHKDERIASRLVRGGNQVIQIDATDYYLKHYANP